MNQDFQFCSAKLLIALKFKIFNLSLIAVVLPIQCINFCLSLVKDVLVLLNSSELFYLAVHLVLLYSVSTEHSFELLQELILELVQELTLKLVELTIE